MTEVFATLVDALLLRPALFEDPLAIRIWTALGVALIAAISTMFGHVAILILNRLRGLQILTSLALTFAALGALYGAQAFSIWAVASLVLRKPLEVVPLVFVAALAMAPQAFAFLTALPHFGLIIGRFLEIWGFLIFWFGVSKIFGMDWLPSLIITLAGWLVMQLISRLVHRPLSWLVARAWTLATGRPTMITSKDVLAGMPMIPVEGVKKNEQLGARR